MQARGITTHERKERLTLWLSELALLYAGSDSLVELGIENVVVRDRLVVGKDVFLDG